MYMFNGGKEKGPFLSLKPIFFIILSLSLLLAGDDKSR